MCGRYASTRKRIELLEEFSVQRDMVAEPLKPDYNVAPTKPVYAVLDRVESTTAEPVPAGGVDSRDDAAREVSRAGVVGGSGGASAERELRVVRWGLVPFWAKDVKIGSRMINARAETVAEKPAFRRAFAKRRCLLPADGYYEWQSLPGVPKQPMYISRADGRSLAFAGLYELWRDPSVDRGDEDAWLWTATIITTSATDELGMIHDRMPMIIDPAGWADWLDPANSDVADVRALLSPAGARDLITYPVSTEVNSVRNNGPQLLERIDPGPVAPLTPVGAADLGVGAAVSARAGRADRGDDGTGVLWPA
ncbi:MAG TPA: SOS response-associated peptidase [Streptosporangiaceae bacterium]|jgi:putative SOS response-associated peptidase YedK|nr:SOS response-associated peptidase [Streptosporangiaceae bacterium]